ncbi:hypothetical protein D1F52_13170 [Enterococcus faecalis]|nr:hypothetical protein [Enterococcus faecalis]EGO9034405.1 hypothetical protein [Enterococcus faecalis]
MLAILHQLWVVPVTQQGISYRRFLLFLKLIQLLLLYAFLRTGVRSVHSLVRQTFSVILTLFSFFRPPTYQIHTLPLRHFRLPSLFHVGISVRYLSADFTELHTFIFCTR